jgi:hypothetical protein
VTSSIGKDIDVIMLEYVGGMGDKENEKVIHKLPILNEERH